MAWDVAKSVDSHQNIIKDSWSFRGAGRLRGRAFAHGAMGRRIDPSWGGPIELFLVPASALRLV